MPLHIVATITYFDQLSRGWSIPNLCCSIECLGKCQGKGYNTAWEIGSSSTQLQGNTQIGLLKWFNSIQMHLFCLQLLNTQGSRLKLEIG